ncbi:MAG: hypothetical protein FWE71_08610 [Nocardioidaceae bacterium]|nr:hypothetical protein [Nocardioidaceae bacterium]
MTPETDRYDELLRLADAYDQAGERMREWSSLGPDVLADPAVAESAELSPRTWSDAEDAIRTATVGKRGLLTRSLELDADALVLRATVLTYRWIDELQTAAYQTLGSIAGRAIGYLAPEIELGGAVVAAGLIETGALDRDGMAAYLGELALAHPDLMEHVTTGGGLVESLQVRGMLTSSALADDPAVARGGLRAIGVEALTSGLGAAVRDAAAGVSGDVTEQPGAEVADTTPLAGLGDLLRELQATTGSLGVRRIGPDRAVVLLPATVDAGDGGGLVSGQPMVDALGPGLAETLGSATRVVVVAGGASGGAAIDLARSGHLRVDQVITASSPASHLRGLPAGVPVLSFDHRTDPVALLGSLINAKDEQRLTVLYDGADDEALVSAGRTADSSEHPALVAFADRLRELGYLA